MHVAFRSVLFSPSAAWDLGSTTLSSRSPPPTSPVTSPCATATAPCPRLPVPSALLGLFLLFCTISPVFLARLLAKLHPSSFHPRFSIPAPRPSFLQRGPNIFYTPSPQPQSFSPSCFSPPTYATSTNKGQDPSSSPFGVQEVNDAEHKSQCLCQEAPRRALPETSCSESLQL